MTNGWTDGQIDGRTGRTDSPCILQDFVPSGTLWGRCPAYLTATIMKCCSRARVPMTISCLWATGFFYWSSGHLPFAKRNQLMTEKDDQPQRVDHPTTNDRLANNIFRPQPKLCVIDLQQRIDLPQPSNCLKKKTTRIITHATKHTAEKKIKEHA